MDKTLGKLVIFTGCALLQYILFPVNMTYITILLFSFIMCIGINSSNDITHSKFFNTSDLITYVYMGMSFFVPQMTVFLPALLWNICDNRNIISSIFYIANTIYLLFSEVPHKTELTIYFLFLTVVSACLRQLSIKTALLENELKTNRDTSKEYELAIEQKNRALLESQDANVYAAMLKERNRIAREIHDNVGHMLTRSILQIGAIKTINKNEVLAQPLNNLHETLDIAMNNIRSSVHDLHDESIDLKSSIYDIINGINHIDIKLDYDVAEHVPRNIKYNFISIIKESVNNTVKHSNASKLAIVIREHPSFYQLLVEDNGTNIMTSQSNGIGLTGITERVNNMGGNLKISTDNGFKILITVFK